MSTDRIRDRNLLHRDDCRRGRRTQSRGTQAEGYVCPNAESQLYGMAVSPNNKLQVNASSISTGTYSSLRVRHYLV